MAKESVAIAGMVVTGYWDRRGLDASRLAHAFGAGQEAIETRLEERRLGATPNGISVPTEVNLGGGLRLNVGKSGMGLSIGTKGFRIGVNSRGQIRTTVGIPGTGISYSRYSRSASARERTKSDDDSLGCLVIVGMLFSALCYSVWKPLGVIMLVFWILGLALPSRHKADRVGKVLDPGSEVDICTAEPHDATTASEPTTQLTAADSKRPVERPDWLKLAAEEEDKLNSLLGDHPAMAAHRDFQMPEVHCAHKYHRSGLTREECEAKQRYYAAKKIIEGIQRELSFQQRWKERLLDYERQLRDFPDLRVEWISANDERTCDECRQRDGKVYTIPELKEVHRHIGCRCTLAVHSDDQ